MEGTELAGNDEVDQGSTDISEPDEENSDPSVSRQTVKTNTCALFIYRGNIKISVC